MVIQRMFAQTKHFLIKICKQSTLRNNNWLFKQNTQANWFWLTGHWFAKAASILFNWESITSYGGYWTYYVCFCTSKDIFPRPLGSHITFLLNTFSVEGTVLSATLRLKSINLATYTQEL